MHVGFYFLLRVRAMFGEGEGSGRQAEWKAFARIHRLANSVQHPPGTINAIIIKNFNHFVYLSFSDLCVTGSGSAEVIIIVLVKVKPSSADNPHLP